MLVTTPQTQVSLQLIPRVTARQDCQTLSIDLLKRMITVDELRHLELPPEVQTTHGIVLFGKAPNWLYCHLVERFHQAAWIACCNLPLQAAIVISSNVRDLQPGDRIPIQVKATPGAAVLIGGPPKSGKSVFANALRLALSQSMPDLTHYLFRANWDGEGNHTFETPDQKLVDRLRQQNNRKLHHQQAADTKLKQYFRDRAAETTNIREMIDLTLVDVGGKPDPVKLPVIQQCTHYIVISRDAEAIPAWHTLCHPHLKPLAVIHSVLDDRLEILQTDPLLEIIAGSWLREQTRHIPDVLLQQVQTILK